MAINLKKEFYSNNDEIRQITPEEEHDEIYPQKEIYPQREIYPQANTQQPSQAVTEETTPQNEVRHIETVTEELPQVHRAPVLPEGKKQKKIKKKKKKHGFRNFLIAALVIAVGSTAVIEWAQSEGYNVQIFSHPVYTLRHEDLVGAGIEALTVYDKNSHIKIVSSRDSDFHIVASETQNSTYKINCDEKTITIEKEGRGTFALFSFDIHSQELTVEVPKEYAGMINLDTSNSSIECGTGKNIDIKNSNGAVELSGIDGDTVTVETSNGRISASDISAKDLDLSSSNGRIAIDSATVSGETVLESDNARIEASGCAFGTDGRMSSDNGAVVVKDCDMGENMMISTDNGRAEMNDFTFKNLSVRSKNGSIIGSAYGNVDDYNVKTYAKNGSVNAEGSDDNKDAKYLLELNSRNGSITFSFDGASPML